MRSTTALELATLVCLSGCGGSSNDSNPPADVDVLDATSEVGPDSVPDGSEIGGDVAPTSCEPFGHFPAPTVVFALPAGTTTQSYPDVQKSFPTVDWSKLDRLYIPAGKYKSIQLGNLPTRDPARPLVITNQGGQVQVGPNDPGAGFIWSLGGGSNWILTGRYDPDSKTGDAGFPGHRCGDYAGSRGKYGFLSNDEFATGTYLHMGIAVASATSFELEYLEIERSGFAGIRLLNSRAAGEPATPMENVRVHDNYVHDTGGEGFYFGWTGAPPSNLLAKLAIYNNRIIRTGNEALQVQDLGDGSEVHHNAILFGALHWRDNGLGKYQDGNAQVLAREGNIAFHHNLFVGGSALLLSFFSAPEPGDGGRHVIFSDNYFADTLNLGGYLNGTSGSDSSFTFDRNYFRGLEFGYQKLDPTATDPGVIFGKNAPFAAPITFSNNSWEGSRKLVAGLAGPNGTSGNVTATANTNGPVAAIAFVGSESFDVDPKRHLEMWAPKATVAAGSPAIVYAVGDRVMYLGELYECIASSSGEAPADHPASWKKLPTPVDDVRVVPGSPYAAMGVH
jgi:hypothetical protein